MDNVTKAVHKESLTSKFNLASSCKKLGVPFWRCPQFLFLVMGVLIIITIIAAYFIATSRIGDPFLVSMLVLLLGAFLLIINFIITSSFERVAEASKMKTEFIDIVSHQLRAPITNLRFSLDFLLSDKNNKLSAEQLEYVTILQENTERMNGLVDNLLTVSRMESGRFPMKKKNISVAKITQKLVRKFKPFIEASNVDVSLHIPQATSDVFADPLWLEQVVENLLDNAIRYTKGGGMIVIKIKEEKDKIYFKIEDNGVGIPKEEQKHIFVKFFRSANALKKQTKGSGLGLHISKKIIELSEGKIWFKSKEGHGTAFHFILPIVKQRS